LPPTTFVRAVALRDARRRARRAGANREYPGSAIRSLRVAQTRTTYGPNFSCHREKSRIPIYLPEFGQVAGI